MKITTEPREDHQMKVVAEFAASDLDKYKQQAARRIASKAKIPGFRPGKAPYDVIARLYGEPAIEEDAIELMVEKVYPDILTEAKIEPAAPGTLEDIQKEDPLKFTFVVPLEPTVELGNYLEIRKKYTPKPVTANQVDEFITRLQRTYATAEPVERPAQKDDLVYVKVDATLQKPAEDEKAEILKDTPLQLVIGENDPEENDYPYAGFGDNLIGMSANEEKTVKYTYPKDTKFEKLRGKAVEFHILLQNVKKLTLPELNDEFAKMFGEYENFKDLKAAVKTQIEMRQNGEYDQEYFNDLLEEMLKIATVKYPPQVLEHEMEHVVENVTHDLEHQKMELDVYLKTIKKEKEEWLESDVKPAARKRLERMLLLQELSKLENVQVEKEELQAEITTMLTEIQDGSDAKQIEKQLRNKKVANALTMEAASRVMDRKVYLRLKEIATGMAAEKEAEAKPAAKKAVTKTGKTAEKDAEAGAEKPAKPKKAKSASAETETTEETQEKK